MDELYDLQADPWEVRNLAAEDDRALAELRATLAAELEQLGDPLMNLFCRDQLLGASKPAGGIHL
jgi:hypothetical protein